MVGAGRVGEKWEGKGDGDGWGDEGNGRGDGEKKMKKIFFFFSQFIIRQSFSIPSSFLSYTPLLSSPLSPNVFTMIIMIIKKFKIKIVTGPNF